MSDRRLGDRGFKVCKKLVGGGNLFEFSTNIEFSSCKGGAGVGKLTAGSMVG